jgi:hypothetical protein
MNPLERPTMYFIGVTTKNLSVPRPVFVNRFNAVLRLA